MQPLKNLITVNYVNFQVMKKVEASLIVEEANKIIKEQFGEKVMKYVSASFIKNKVLTMVCLSSAMAQELKLNEKKIINKLNEKFGLDTVEKLRFLA